MATIGNLEDVVARLAGGAEIAVLDVRLREDYVAAHPLIATSAPADVFDIILPQLVPGPNTELLLVGDAPSLATATAAAAQAGYGKVAVIDDVLGAWRTAGLPVFEDINTLPKAFGEFVEHAYATPSTSADALAARLASGDAVTVVDCRPEPEYLAAHVPSAIHIPGTDLVGAAGALQQAGREVVIHCGGRTRGIIAAQVLRDIGLQLPVSVLANGTFGWELAGHALAAGPGPAGVPATEVSIAWADRAVQGLVQRFGLGFATPEALAALRAQRDGRALYLIDLRALAVPAIAGARAVSGGQLIQTVDSCIATQNAPIVLIADQEFAAIATASWLVRLGWGQVVLARPGDALDVFGPAVSSDGGPVPRIAARDLAAWVRDATRPPPLILDLSPSHLYVAGHLAGAIGVRRADIATALADQPQARPIVLTASDPRLAAQAWAELPADRRGGAVVLDDWRATGLPGAIGPAGALSETPWLNARLVAHWQGRDGDLAAFVDAELERFAAADGVATLADAKQGYLDWEIGLIDRIPADRTLRFRAD